MTEPEVTCYKCGASPDYWHTYVDIHGKVKHWCKPACNREKFEKEQNRKEKEQSQIALSEARKESFVSFADMFISHHFLSLIKDSLRDMPANDFKDSMDLETALLKVLRTVKGQAKISINHISKDDTYKDIELNLERDYTNPKPEFAEELKEKYRK